jgi:small subunit ribosomal protein S17
MASLEKLQTGIVVSNKMDKTVVVRIDRFKRHRLYGKTIRVTQRYKAHDETNACGLGDVVRIAETRPLSREKRWRVVDIVTRGDVAEVAPREIAARLLEETLAEGRAEAEAAAEAAKAARKQAAATAGDDAAEAAGDEASDEDAEEQA